jgi:nitroreductase
MLWERRRLVLAVLDQLPRAIRAPIGFAVWTTYLLANYAYDLRRFLRWSGVGGRGRSRTTTCARITIESHRLEKALALRGPHASHGARSARGLLRQLEAYVDRFGTDTSVRVAVNVLAAYAAPSGDSSPDSADLAPGIERLQHRLAWAGPHDPRGGTLCVRRAEIHAAARHDLVAFFEHRHSIRDFAEGDVDLTLIAAAVQMAQKTPSVCNRQSTRVYVFGDPASKAVLLAHQGGSRGFGERASQVLVVTSDLRHFVTVGERNQCWCDGGMFAMSLVYALHSLGLGTCCLNWCVDSHQDRKLRRAAGIGDPEAIIMMIAIGLLPEELRVAQSPRKALDEVMVVRTGLSAPTVADQSRHWAG